MKYFKRIVLYPFAILYDAITSIRNLLFDLKIIKSFEPKVFSIGIGNLTVGGTGKTPVVDYFLQNFHQFNLAVISRGYGRNTKGFIEINKNHKAIEVGDEPKMLFDKNHSKSRFFVSENRALGYQNALKIDENLNLLIFDDVYQHRSFKPQLLILLCDYNRPFFNDFLLPSGFLREARRGAKRADFVIVTKCPKTLKDSEIHLIENELRKYIDISTKIYFSNFENSLGRNIENVVLNKGNSAILISALANNEGFRLQTENDYRITNHFAYNDHYSYRTADIESVLNHSNLPILTTLKDFVKIKELCDADSLKRFFVIDQKLHIWQEKDFINTVLTKINASKST